MAAWTTHLRRGAPDAAVSGGSATARLPALIRKEFIQLRRDRRTLAIIVGMPLIFVLIFGYAASFDVTHISTELVGGDSALVRRGLEAGGAFSVRDRVAPDEAAARSDLLHGRATVAVLVGSDGRPRAALVDGSNILVASTALRALGRATGASRGGAAVTVTTLYNPTLRSADFMVPALIGLIMMQVGVVVTALGVVRERESGTLEQLLITPLTKLELMVGKLVPYLLIAFVDLVTITAVGLLVFDVPLRGSPPLLLALSLVFAASTLGIGLLLSTVATNQRQAMQMALFIMLPQILLSGWVFPLASIPWGVRWLSYLFPLTYYLPVVRGIFLKGLGLEDLWPQALVLLGMAVAFVCAAAARFTKQLG
jgi:ABC transporter DrrB family efflux protein